MLARHVRSEKLWERETKERTALITMLRNEDEYYSGLVAAQRKKVIMLDFEPKARRARQNVDKARDKVYGCEFDYLGFVDERRAVSPRAIRQGFTDALEENVDDWRRRVTQSKVECLFEHELELRKIQEGRLKEQTKLDDIEWLLVELELNLIMFVDIRQNLMKLVRNWQNNDCWSKST